MQKTIKSRLDGLEQQLNNQKSGPTMIVIDVVNASEEGPHEVVPAGYTCEIKGKRHYFPGDSEQAGTAVRALMAQEPREPGKVRRVPILIACLEAPAD